MKKILIINIEKNIRMLILERERVSKINIESTMVYNPIFFSIFFIVILSYGRGQKRYIESITDDIDKMLWTKFGYNSYLKN